MTTVGKRSGGLARRKEEDIHHIRTEPEEDSLEAQPDDINEVIFPGDGIWRYMLAQRVGYTSESGRTKSNRVDILIKDER